MSREEELKIIERIKDGDTSLYNQLVSLHSPKILSIVRGVVRNREDAEEVAQDVFVKAYFSLSRFRGESSFSTWIFRIAYNMSISKTRGKRKESVLCDNLGYIPDNSAVDYEEKESKERVYKLLYETIEYLEPSDRFIILSFYNHDKSIREIATICSMTESNVKVKLHRIKKRLNSLMEGKIDICYDEQDKIFKTLLSDFIDESVPYGFENKVEMMIEQRKKVRESRRENLLNVALVTAITALFAIVLYLIGKYYFQTDIQLLVDSLIKMGNTLKSNDSLLWILLGVNTALLLIIERVVSLKIEKRNEEKS
jgi:RNA polymerase sigma-70 factor (ECF subfamily)